MCELLGFSSKKKRRLKRPPLKHKPEQFVPHTLKKVIS